MVLSPAPTHVSAVIHPLELDFRARFCFRWDLCFWFIKGSFTPMWKNNTAWTFFLFIRKQGIDKLCSLNPTLKLQTFHTLICSQTHKHTHAFQAFHFFIHEYMLFPLVTIKERVLKVKTKEEKRNPIRASVHPRSQLFSSRVCMNCNGCVRFCFFFFKLVGREAAPHPI